MKKNQFLTVMFLAIFVSSCNKTNIDNYPELIIGGWLSKNVTINGIESSTINESLDEGSQLYLGADSKYYRNYRNGFWELYKSQITLSAPEWSQSDDWNYEIMELTESTLKVKINLTIGEFGWGIDQFGDDEILTIIETYTRQ